jgi:hypothetical protein
MNWIQRLQQILAVAPYAIVGIQAIHNDAKGADKKTIALESLGLASALGAAVAPEVSPQIQVVSKAVGNVIDEVVTALHGLNAPGFGTNSAPAAPAQ